MIKAMRHLTTLAVAVLLASPMLCAQVGDNTANLVVDEAKKDLAAELDKVEAVVNAREKYKQQLRLLIAYYDEKGNVHRKAMAEEELSELMKVPENYYVVMVEGLQSVDPARFRKIPAADKRYELGIEQKEALDLLNKKERLKLALKYLKGVLVKYPQSDKCDDAAYAIAQIYRGFYYRDYYRALKYYEACYRWNPGFPHKVRWRIGDIYDYQLKDYDTAMMWYKLSVKNDPEDFARRSAERIEELKEMAEKGEINLGLKKVEPPK